MSKVVALLQRDLRVFYRDGFMIMLFLYPPLLALLARALVPLAPVEDLALSVAPAVALFSGPRPGGYCACYRSVSSGSSAISVPCPRSSRW